MQPKDIVIIMGFCHCTPEEAAEHKPKVVVLDEDNEIVNQE